MEATEIKKTYILSCGKVTQEELTVAGEERLSEILDAAGVSDLAEFFKMKVKGMVNVLLKKKVLRKILSVIIVKESGDNITEDEAGKITASQQMEIIGDFFALNPSAIQLLGILGAASDMIALPPKSSPSDSNAASSKPDS